ncbi:LamG-like jellyroll fold domain-containing protein [Leifsonia sp. Root112D2]|uniref:LamG-like jellyroll fold domain-containing protein n=1 Tax=Leifsonia sp. Root112D2 TaxID=1736426 RepID=UPI001F2492E5|nr:LamG-like jellyroll fold domain-containing protein [Leifsonia sp. Root112D2]
MKRKTMVQMLCAALAVLCTVGLTSAPATAATAAATGATTAATTAAAAGTAAGTAAGIAPANMATVKKATTKTSTWSGKVAPLSTPWTAKVSPSNALPDYPRPQLARPSVKKSTWMNLNGLWQYAETDGYSPPPFGTNLEGKILVPYPAESALSGVQKHSDYMFYRRTVDVPKSYTNAGQHVRLNFGAVNYDATVYVNGQQVARHTGGYDAFSVDITSALHSKGSQEIVVAVHSPVDSATIPVGKQRLDPSGIFYTAASGIWQTVWLEPVAATSIATLTATPDVKNSSFTISTTLNGDPSNARLEVTAYAGNKKVASASGAASGSMKLNIPKPRLWSPSDPFLYTFKAELKAHGSTDTVESYAGLRSIAIANVEGKQRIVLNGKPTFLLSTLDQGYWPDGIYTAPTDDALKFDIQKTKDLGFNTIRKHIKVEPARWYYWADKLGLMVWQDAPALPTGRNGSLSVGDKANFRSEVSSMVTQLKDVTSIIGWIPFNEGWGQWSVQAASDVGAQVKALDPTRLVNDRSGFNCCDTPGDPGTGDIIDWHQYQGPALPAPDAKRASIDGEHGGLTLPIEGHTWPGASLDPYGAVKDEAELNDKYVANTAVLRDQGAPYGLSGAVYTQITDVENELNGFFTYDRQVEKVNEKRVRAINLAVIAAGTKPAPTPPAGTPGPKGVGAWNFDEASGTLAHDAVGKNDLTLKNGASFAPGANGDSGTALKLNGTNQSADAAKTVLKTDGVNYSVSAWVKFDKTGKVFQTVMSEDGDANSAFFLQYSGADDRLAFSFANARALANTVGSPKAGQWYHMVGVRDLGASTLKIYVDGKLSGSVSVLGNGDTGTGSLVVGRGKFGGNPVDYLAGTVDGARVFDRALSADEVAALYAAGPQG